MTTYPLAALAMLISGALASAQTVTQGGQNMDWPTYTAALDGSRYRPLDQINASNFNQLEVAWRFKTDAIGSRPEYKLEGTPLAIGGVLYATAGTRRGVVALDAVTGELMWMHSEREGARGAAAPRQLSGRGLAYWADGDDKRVLYVTPGYRLIALDAGTGQPAAGFGENGVVDLKLDFDQELKPDLTTAEVGLHATPLIVGNVILVGNAFREGFTPRTGDNTKGYVRAYDARTGKRLWTFHTIPKKGEPGYETWLDGSADRTGNTGVWTQMTADPDLGLAYLPVETPSSDFWGGQRPGNNLYANSIVAVDLKTGKPRWHYQMIHHDIWDFDNSSAPLLLNIKVRGKMIKAIAIPSKQGFLYVLDRTNGKPVWPIPERKVPKGDVPGEWYSPTQPIPSRPPAYARNSLSEDQLIDFTPSLREKAKAVVSKYKIGPIYTPPPLSRKDGPLGLLSTSAAGGTNWPGGSADPENNMVYVFACNSCLYPAGLVPTPPGMSDLKYVVGVDGQPVRIISGPGENAGADAPPAPKGGDAASASTFARLTADGLPLFKPPYSTISAIDLNSGEIKWQVPHGDTPDYVRNSPALKGLTIARTGQPGFGIGTLVTRSLVIAGDPMVTTTSEHPRGAMLRAYDKQTGKEVGAVWMPAPQSGSPMTYMVNGKQYLVVAVSGGTYSGEYICFSLPAAE